MGQDESLPFHEEDFLRGAAGERLSGDYLRGSQPFSGNERNHLFLGAGGRTFHDTSGISGIDSAADGRVLALLDYDQDGRTDIAAVNANSPLLQLYHNEVRDSGNVVAIRLIGGATATDHQGWSNRDGVGAQITITIDGKKQLREQRFGEGFAAQNSRTLRFGIGTAESIDSVEVRWPSGRTQRATAVAAGSLVTVQERLGEKGLSVSSYLEKTHVEKSQISVSKNAPIARGRLTLVKPQSGTRLIVYTAMATWCPGCKRELPQIARLRSAFPSIRLVGLPMDAKDNADKLATYNREYSPAYEIFEGLKTDQRRALEYILKDLLGSAATPATLVTNPAGDIVHAQRGVPSVSRLRLLLTQ